MEYGRRELLKVVGDNPSPWCLNEPPIAYTYIQVRIAASPAPPDPTPTAFPVLPTSTATPESPLGQRVPLLLGRQAASKLPPGSALYCDGALPLL